MHTIGKTIAELRKQKSITQEELAALIGISAQSISKWENDVTMPDVMLLPLIADIFGVSIDTLFGRNEYTKCGFRNLYDKMDESFLELLQSEFYDKYDANRDITLEDRLEDCINFLNTNPKSQTGVYSGENGAIYYSAPTGGVLLKGNTSAWASLFFDKSVIEILQKLCNEDYRRLLQMVGTGSFTLSSITKKFNLDKEKATAILDDFVEYGLLHKEIIDDSDNQLTLFISNNAEVKERLLPLYIALTYLKRFQEFSYNFFSWCG